jgi:hypothetical protein
MSSNNEAAIAELIQKINVTADKPGLRQTIAEIGQLANGYEPAIQALVDCLQNNLIVYRTI